MATELKSPHDARPTNTRWLVLGLIAFASSCAYLTRHCVAAANTTIQKSVGLDDQQMGWIMSIFSLGYFFCQIPGGWLGNRLGTRLAFAFISAVWSLCNVVSAISFSFFPMFASRFLLGCFQAGLVPISAKVIKDWIPVGNRGVSSAAVGASMSLGGAATMWLTGWLLKIDVHWRIVFMAFSSVGIIWAVIYYRLVRTTPEEHPAVNQAEVKLIQQEPAQPDDDKAATGDGNEPNIFLAMLMSLSMWALSIQSFFRAAGYAFFVTWMFAYLEYVFSVPKDQAGLLNSLPLIAVVVGTSTGGIVVDWLLEFTKSKWISRSGTAVFALLMSAILTYLSVFTGSATQMAVVIAIGAMFSGLGSPPAWCASIDLGGKHTPVVIATMNMSGAVAGFVLPVLLGGWIKSIRAKEADGFDVTGDWRNVIFLHAGFYLIGAICWLFVRPNRTLAG